MCYIHVSQSHVVLQATLRFQKDVPTPTLQGTRCLPWSRESSKFGVFAVVSSTLFNCFQSGKLQMLELPTRFIGWKWKFFAKYETWHHQIDQMPSHCIHNVSAVQSRTKSKLCELHMRWSLLLVSPHCSSSRCRAPEQIEQMSRVEMLRNVWKSGHLWEFISCRLMWNSKRVCRIGTCHHYCRNLSCFTLFFQAFLAVDKSPDAFPRTETWIIRRILIEQRVRGSFLISVDRKLGNARNETHGNGIKCVESVLFENFKSDFSIDFNSFHSESLLNHFRFHRGQTWLSCWTLVSQSELSYESCLLNRHARLSRLCVVACGCLSIFGLRILRSSIHWCVFWSLCQRLRLFFQGVNLWADLHKNSAFC